MTTVSIDSLIVLIMLSSVLLLVTAVTVLLALKYRKYRSRPYLLSSGLFLAQTIGLFGTVLRILLDADGDSPFDVVLRPLSLIGGITTLVILIAYIVEVKVPGKLNLRRSLIIISPAVILSALMVLVPQSTLHSTNELFDGIRRPDVLLRLSMLFLYIAYPVAAALQPYEWRQCMVSRRMVAALHILSLILPPFFTAGLLCGYFPAIVINYIFAVSVDALVVYIELRIRIPVAEPALDTEDSQKPVFKNQADESILARPEIWMNPDMTSTELARIMGTNRTYLLNMIKSLGYQGYPDMINRKRVQYICRGLEKDDDVNITGLMYESGFRSRSTASSEFKRIVGCTPSEYQKDVKAGSRQTFRE